MIYDIWDWEPVKPRIEDVRDRTLDLLRHLIDRIESGAWVVSEATETLDLVSYYREGDTCMSRSPSGWSTVRLRLCNADQNMAAFNILSDNTVTQVHDEV